MIDLNKLISVVRTKAEKPDIHFYISVHKKTAQRHAQSGSKLCSWFFFFFSKKVNESEKNNNSNPDGCFFSDK